MTFLRRAIPAFFFVTLLASAQQGRWQKSIDAGLQALSQGAFEAAETNLQSALDQAQSLGPAEISKTQLYLGYLAERLKQYDKAAGLYSRAVSVREKALGVDHLDVAAALELEARALGNTGRTVEPDALLARATEIRRKAMRVKFPKETAPEGVGSFRVASVGTPPQVISRVEPEYSEEARLFHLDGSIEVSIEVWPDGRAHNIEIRRGLGLGLDEKAVEAIQQWRFRPAEKDGKSVIVSAVVTVDFHLL